MTPGRNTGSRTPTSSPMPSRQLALSTLHHAAEISEHTLRSRKRPSRKRPRVLQTTTSSLKGDTSLSFPLFLAPGNYS
jgi:hypothetical protein